MNKLFRITGMILLIAVLVFSLTACGQRTLQNEPVATVEPEPTKEVVVETPPPSPTPSPTPTPTVTVPPVAVTTVPMPMPSVSPTVAVTNEPVPTDANGNPVAATAAVSPSPSVSPSPVDGHLNANGVNLRGGPSTSARILGTYDSGTYVSVLGTENGWTEVIINGEVGYVKSEYVTSGYVGSNAASAPSNAVVVGDGNGVGLVIVPDGPVSNTTAGNSVVSTPDLGPDIYGGTPIG